jgi:hypothetical protein
MFYLKIAIFLNTAIRFVFVMQKQNVFCKVDIKGFLIIVFQLFLFSLFITYFS